jgi:hypothetical protein
MSSFRLRFAALAAFSIAALATTAVGATNSFATQFPSRVLTAQNIERARAGLQPMAWDDSLGSAAAAYAQQMALTGRFQHSDRSQRRGVGENLWMGTHGAFTVETMVGGWSSEKRFFVPGVFPNVSSSGNWEDVGHYTQMIWPTTSHVGCALASNGRFDYLVCRYANAGNIDGRRVP